MNDRKSIWANFLTNLHESFIREMHEIERNFISIVITIISSTGIFGFGLKLYLGQPHEQNYIFFTVTTAGAIALQLIVIFMSNIQAYSYRKSQIILSKIEKEIEKLTQEKIFNNILPANWNYCDRVGKCESAEPPEIFLFFKCVALLTIIFMLALYLELSLLKIVIQEINQIIYLILIASSLLFVVILISFLNALYGHFQYL